MAAELELGVDALFGRDQPELLATLRLAAREGLQLRVGQRRAAPQRERLAEQPGAVGRPDVARLARQTLETPEVDLLRLDRELVPRRLPDECLRPEHPTQLRDGVLERGLCRLGRALAPDLGDQPLRRDRLVRTQQKE